MSTLVESILLADESYSYMFHKDGVMYITKYVGGEFITKEGMKDPNYKGNRYDWVENITEHE